jgi:hypothetical protein
MGMRHAVPQLVLAGALSSLAIPGSALAGQASLSPATGAPGSSVVVHGTGFPGSKRVTVKLTGRSVVRVKASSGGSFTARVKAPSGRRGWITVTSRSGSRKVVNRFYATRGGAGQVVEVASTSGRRLRLTPASIAPGQTMRIDGAGFKKGRTVRLSGFGLSRRYRASRSGRFTALISLPDSLKAGSYRATVRAAGVRLVVGIRVRPVSVVGAPGAGLPPVVVQPQPQPLPQPGPVAPAKKPPANTVLPKLTATLGPDGKVHEGAALKVTAGTWSNAPRSYAYQWQRCTDTSGCANIAGARTTSYTAVKADVGFALSVLVTATNVDGSATARSNLTDAIAAKAYPTGLIAQWHMNELSGPMLDSSGNGHHGTTRSIAYGQAGFAGTAFGFNGTGSQVTVPIGDMSPGPQDVTLALKMKTTTLPPVPGPQDWDLLRAGFYATGGEFKMELYPDGSIACGFRGDAPKPDGYIEVHSDPLVSNVHDGLWHDIKCLRTGNYVSTVVDGVEVKKHRVLGSIVIGDDLAIGAHPNAEYFNGQLDEASIAFG